MDERRAPQFPAPGRPSHAAHSRSPLPILEAGRSLLDRLNLAAARPGFVTLLVRAFLGVTFTFAGLQKLANPSFFSASAPGSFNQQLLGAMHTSPIHELLVVTAHAPTFVAVVIALGEVAVGLGTLAGLLTRIAALGGMALSLSFFLTISWTASPYYYGADIVFFFAWTPLLLGGGGLYSLDGLIARRRGAAAGSGHSAGEIPPVARRDQPTVTRRAALAGLGVFGALVVGMDVLVGRLLAPKNAGSSGIAALGGGSSGTSGTTARSSGSATTTSGAGSTTTVAGAPKGTRLGRASQVPVGGAASFTDPAQGVPAYVVQPVKGTFKAFSAVCTHAGCQVEFDRQQEEFVCPCHGSVFNAATGAVVQGPAQLPLPAIPLVLGPDDELYVDS